MSKPDLVDIAGIAARLDVKRKTVDTWLYERSLLPPVDFPDLRHPLWLWSTIRQWAIDTGRLTDD